MYFIFYRCFIHFFVFVYRVNSVCDWVNEYLYKGREKKNIIHNHLVIDTWVWLYFILYSNVKEVNFIPHSKCTSFKVYCYTVNHCIQQDIAELFEYYVFYLLGNQSLFCFSFISYLIISNQYINCFQFVIKVNIQHRNITIFHKFLGI